MTKTKSKFKYDVFISYSSKDKDWVRGELLPRIEQAGLKAFIDFRDFTPGAPSIKEMARGVLECRKTLLILSPEYIESEWCELESIMSQTLSPANRDLRTIPLLKAKCDKPLYTGALTHINFTDGADLNLAWKQLLTALGAPPEPEKLEEPQRNHWFLAHPYPMPPNFTGRVVEREMLTKWLSGDDAHPLLSLRALGGFGKSALVWHWLMNDVEPSNWQRVIWWSFYESDASFDSFVIKTLDYLSGGQIKLTRPSADHVATLVNMLCQPGVLLVLDGFERELRAFGGMGAAYQGDDAKTKANDRDCISPLAETFLRCVPALPGLKSRVLLTTRLRPRAFETRNELLQGCRDEELTQMQPSDAVGYFRARGVRGTHVEIEAACAPYGYHPLSLCLLAGLIVGDFEQPGDIAVARGLDVSGDLLGRKTHVLKVAYDSLSPERQALLSRIACFRSPTTYKALKELAETDEKPTAALDKDLKDLVARGLLHHDSKQGRFDLHPIVRSYAYDRLAGADRAAAHESLRDYFAAVPPKDNVTCLEDLNPVIELYHHTVRAGQYDEACDLFHARLASPLYHQLGTNQLRIDLLRSLFPDGEDQLPCLKKDSAQASVLNVLANSYGLSGQPSRSVPLFETSNDISEKRGSYVNLSIGLGNLASAAQIYLGALRDAETNLRRRIRICGEIRDDLREAIGHLELGRLLAYRGVYAESETELMTALKVLENQKEVQWQGVVCAYRAERELLLGRSDPDCRTGCGQSALKSALRALELADETARTFHPSERDYVRAHWLLGATHCVCEQYDDADSHLNEALARCRSINLVYYEADIQLDLARLRAATGHPNEARRLAEEALLITERSGYVLQGADAHLELAKLAFARKDKATALEHAQSAKELATCDGPPDYTYKAAYDEACSLLEKLK